jgi:hypothetical protein
MAEKNKIDLYKSLILEVVEKRKISTLSKQEENFYIEKLEEICKTMSENELVVASEWYKNDLREFIPKENEKIGIKHLVECHCTLPQYRNRKERIFHKFVVFSIIEKEKVLPKYAQCNNCGIIHYIKEIGKSEFIPKDSSTSISTIEDVKYSIPKDIREILDDHKLDLPGWEEVAFIYENKRWGSHIILSSDNTGETINTKTLKILDKDYVKVESIVNQSGPQMV